MLEFNTESNTYKIINSDLNKLNKNLSYELFKLNNKPYVLATGSGLIYEIGTNDNVIDLSNFDKSIDWSAVTFNWGKNIDENNVLICIRYKGTVKFIQINSDTKEIKEKFKGIGEGVSVSPPGAIDNEYIYLSLTTKENLCVIKKINTETEEIVQEKDVTDYWSNKNGRYQIAYMHYEV